MCCDFEEPMWRGINVDVAQTLDGHYYLGCGNRGGREREIVYFERQREGDMQCVMATGQANA